MSRSDESSYRLAHGQRSPISPRPLRPSQLSRASKSDEDGLARRTMPPTPPQSSKTDRFPIPSPRSSVSSIYEDDAMSADVAVPRLGGLDINVIKRRRATATGTTAAAMVTRAHEEKARSGRRVRASTGTDNGANNHLTPSELPYGGGPLSNPRLRQIAAGKGIEGIEISAAGPQQEEAWRENYGVSIMESPMDARIDDFVGRPKMDSITLPFGALRQHAHDRKKTKTPSIEWPRPPVSRYDEAIWYRSKYVAGRIKVQPSFGLYAIPVMTAMDVLSHTEDYTDEQVMDDVVDFFASYGFEPVRSGKLDRFWSNERGLFGHNPRVMGSGYRHRATPTLPGSPFPAALSDSSSTLSHAMATPSSEKFGQQFGTAGERQDSAVASSPLRTPSLESQWITEQRLIFQQPEGSPPGPPQQRHRSVRRTRKISGGPAGGASASNSSASSAKDESRVHGATGGQSRGKFWIKRMLTNK
jgi:hypothetical protein